MQLRPAPDSPAGRALRIGAKAVVSFGLLAWLLSRVDLGQMVRLLAGFDARHLPGILAVNFAFILLRTARYSLILRDHDRFGIPFLLLVRYYLISCFFGLFLPGGVAGDYIRTVRVNRHGGSLGFSIQSAVLERYLGLFALLALTAVLVLLPDSPVHLPDRAEAILWAALAAGAALPALVLARAYRRLPLPQSWRENLDRLRPGTILGATSLSFALQAVGLAFYAFVAHALGMRIPMAVLAPLILVTSFLAMLPISLQGLGVNQTLFVHGLAIYGYTAEGALLFSLTVYAVDLLTGAVGGLLFLLEKRST